uniref:Secreted protein n=1 Tax=Parascaris univalens TaxID=6257 RepID=A0A915BUE8_PARUN
MRRKPSVVMSQMSLLIPFRLIFAFGKHKWIVGTVESKAESFSISILYQVSILKYCSERAAIWRPSISGRT